MLKRFTPIPLLVSSPNLVWWNDASRSVSITSSGGLVSSLLNLSGSGGDFNQATGALQPSTGAQTQNGLNVISFSGAQQLNSSSNFYPDLLSSSMTIFVVAQTVSNGSFQRIVATSPTNRVYLSSNSSNRFIGDFGTGGSPLSLSSGVLATSPFIGLMQWNSSTSTAYLSANNSSPVSGAASYTSTPPSTIIMGNSSFSPNYYLNGFVGEFLVYNAFLNSSEVLAIYRYLSAKWGITLLP